MAKILIFGNSGSGKSTLAKHLCKTQGLAHLDLDTLAWKPTSPPDEGCYTDLLKTVEQQSTEIIFMNLPTKKDRHLYKEY